MLWALIIGAFAAEAPEGSPFASLPYFHHSALAPTKRVEAEFPAVPPEEAAQRHRCMVWVKIGADGRPADARILEGFAGEGCSAPFQSAATAAVQQWKWKPMKVDKQKADVHTQIAVVFSAQQSAPLIDVSREGSPPPEPVKQPKRPQAGDVPPPWPGGDGTSAPAPRPAPAPAPAPTPMPPEPMGPPPTPMEPAPMDPNVPVDPAPSDPAEPDVAPE